MAVDVEVSLVAMHALAHPVGKPTHGENVAGSVKDKRIGLVQALAGEDFFFDWDEARVVGLKCVDARHRLL